MFLILVVLLFKLNQWKKIFSLGIIFSVGFFSALALSAYFNFIGNIFVIKFVIPFLILLLAMFHLSNRKSSKYKNLSIIIFAVFLFSFFNGLGVFKDLENVIARNTSEFLPILLTVLGALVAFLCLMITLFVIKNLLIMIKKIPEVKWVHGLSLITACIALFLVFGRVFI